VPKRLRISTDGPPLIGVFGPLDDDRMARVQNQLRMADERLVALRDTLAARTDVSWESDGLGLETSDRLQRGMFSGWVEGDDAPLGVWVELTPRMGPPPADVEDPTAPYASWMVFWFVDDPEDRPIDIHGWDVQGHIRVITDENRDRFGDVVLNLPARHYDDPEKAAAALAAVCAELAEAALSRPPDAASWLGEGRAGRM
jgi:hypothetical protein